MKKLFAGIFATVLGLGCLTACGEGNKKVVYNVDAAADFLDATYVDQIVDGRVDYDLLNAITYSGATYTVEWSVDVTEGVVLVNNGNETRVDVDEAAAADMDYVLTATVKDPNGATATVKFYATLLKAPSLVPFAITEKPVEDTAYKLYVYNSFGKFDMYFNGQIASKFYLGSVEDYEQSVDVYVEYVEGSDTLFNLYFNDDTAGKQYFGIRQNWNSTKGYWAYNPYIEATPVSQFEYSADYQTIITTVPASSEDVESAPLDTTKTIYWGNSSTASKTYSTIGGLEIADWGGEYGGLPAALVTLGSPAGVSAEEKFAFEKEAISFADSFVGANTVSVGLVGKRYYDVKIAWEVVEGDCITFDDGIFTITNPAAETSVTVKATITLGELTETLTFTATVKPAVVVPEANSTLTIPEANELGNKFEKDKYTEGKYYVTGKIKSIVNTQYGNLYIEDEAGNEFYVYGLNDEYGNKFEAMDPQPKVGDTITAYGQIGKYNSAQMKNAQMTAYTPGEGGENPDTPSQADIVNAAWALAPGETLGVYTLTGVITVAEAYNTEFNNVTVTIVVGDMTDKPIVCFRMKSGDADATNLKVGDTITVTGTLMNYSYDGSAPGTVEFNSGCKLDAVTPAEGGEGGTDTPDTPDTPATLTIAEAIALGNTYAHNTYTTDMYYVTGKIKEVQNAKYGNVIITDGTNEILVYGMYIDVPDSDEDTRYDAMETKPLVGDTVKLLSVVGKFNPNPQLKDAFLVELTAATDAEKVAVEKDALTLPEVCNGEGNFGLIATGANRTEVVISWELTAGSDIASIANGKLSITNPSVETTVTVMATLTCNQSIETKTFNILVKPSTGATWKMVTDASQLTVGAKVIIAALKSDVALGDNQKTNNRESVAITKADGSITFDDATVEVLTLCAGTKDGTFAFQVEEGGYLYAASSSSNHLKTESTLSDNSSWTIEIASTGNATVKAQGTNTRNHLRKNSSSALFACYSSGQDDICIYIYA